MTKDSEDSDNIHLEMELESDSGILKSKDLQKQDRFNLYVFRKLTKISEMQDMQLAKTGCCAEHLEAHLDDCGKYRTQNDKRLMAVDRIASKFEVNERNWDIAKFFITAIVTAAITALAIEWVALL